MFTVRPAKTLLPLLVSRVVLLLLLSLAGPSLSLAYTAPVLSVEPDAEGGLDALGDLPPELVGPNAPAFSLRPDTAHVPTIEMGIADTGVATTLSVLQAPITPTVQFEASAYAVAEDGGSALITVTLTPTSTDPVTVTYATSAGTATAGSDYTATSGTLTFAPDDESKIITVPITNDLLDEADETLDLALSDPVSATLGTPYTATLTIVDNDPPPTVQFSDSAYSVAEDGGAAIITVTLSTASGNSIQVDYATTDATAEAGSDYTATSDTLIFDPGDEFKVITVSITNDLLDEADETLDLALSNPVSATLGTPVTATLTIVDNDPPPVVQLQMASYSVNEAISPAMITATLSAASGLTVTVDYAMTGGTATANVDYVADAGSLVFAPGEVTQVLSVRVTDDVFDEDDETVDLELSDPVNATLGATTEATLTIADDDAPPTVGFDRSSYTVDEGAGLATITVTLSAPSSRSITVHYATSDGTATAPSDYTATEDDLLFSPPAVTVPATVEHEFETSVYDPPSPDPAGVAYISHLDRLMISDSEVEEMPIFEGVNVFVSTLSGTLVDTFSTMDFSQEPTGVAYNPANHHLFFSDDNRGRIFELDPGDDGLYGTGDDGVSEIRTTQFGSYDPEGLTYDTWRGYLFLSEGAGEEVYEISPGANGVFDGVPGSSPTGDDEVTQFDTDRLNVHNPEGVEFDPHTGHLYVLGGSHDPIAETTIDGKLIRYIDISSLGARNPGSLAYGPSSTDPSQWHLYVVERGVDNDADPNENDGKAYEISFPPGETTRTFTVPILDDIVAEGSETVNLTLSAPVNATLDPSGSSAALTIVDGLSSVQFSVASYNVNEGGGSATITAALSVPSALTVTVDYAASGGTATPGSDYIAASGTLTFPAGTVAQTFDVTIIDDAFDEVDEETVNLVLSNPGNAEMGTPAAAVLRIQDDDPPPTVHFSQPVFWQAEDGVKANIGVELSEQSAFVVTVDYATSDGTATAGSDYVAVSGTLTFEPGTTAQSFSVYILDDALDEPAETANLALSDPSNAAVGTPTTTLTIVDDDGACTVQFSSSAYSVAEDGGTATITVTLSAQSGQSVTVQYATSNGTATAGSDYTGTSGTLTFAPGQTVRTFSVAITDDNVDETDETVNLALSSPSNAMLGTPSTAALTITDDDEQPSVEFDAASYSAAEGSGQASITAMLSHPSAFAVSVDYGTSDGTALAGDDYQTASGTLTFAPGQTEQSFEVTLLADTLDETDETVDLALSGPVINATLGTRDTATLTILDDDSPSTVRFDASSYSVVESAGSITITVTLSTPSSKPVSVDYETSDGTALAGSDYLAASGTLVFAPGVTERAFSVTIIVDEPNEENETLGLILSDPDNATLGTPSSVTLTIIEDSFSVYLPLVFRSY